MNHQSCLWVIVLGSVTGPGDWLGRPWRLPVSELEVSLGGLREVIP